MIIKDLLILFIKSAETFGLNNIDIKHAEDFLYYNEWELCFSQITEQLYENDIKIDYDFYTMAITILDVLKIKHEEYIYLKELIVLSNN